MKTLTENLKKICNYYGYDNQSEQCIEEMAELIQAIQKYRRATGFGQPTENRLDECINNITEEIADVQVMLWEMQILMENRQDVERVIHEKVDRTIRRIS